MSENEKICPYCGEKIKTEAKKCKHCKSWLNNETEKNNIDNENTKITSYKLEKNPMIMAIIVVIIIFVMTIINLNSPAYRATSGCEDVSSRYHDNFVEKFYDTCKNRPWKRVKKSESFESSKYDSWSFYMDDTVQYFADVYYYDGVYHCNFLGIKQKSNICNGFDNDFMNKVEKLGNYYKEHFSEFERGYRYDHNSISDKDFEEHFFD